MSRVMKNMHYLLARARVCVAHLRDRWGTQDERGGKAMGRRRG